MPAITLSLNNIEATIVSIPETEEKTNISSRQLISGFRAKIIFYLISFRLFLLTIKKYSNVKDIIYVLKKLTAIRKLMNDGKPIPKYVKANGKYYGTMYAPAFPSKQFSKMYDLEMERIKPVNQKMPYLRFVFLAITRKCPLACEHCFEWKNLNKKETLTYEDLRKVIIRLKDAGIVQVFLSGGEPMLRVKEIINLSEEFHRDIDMWVLTSGFNATHENLLKMKQAGVTGLFVSLDHYDPLKHNEFRGSDNAYTDAISAIKNACALEMPVAMSVCVTRNFANEKDLMNYTELAKSLDASFIQLLEPKSVGQYEGKNILLEEDHKTVIENFASMVNNEKYFRNYPMVLYHGYQQRKVGCFAAGNRSLYIDSNGDVQSCPFCHHNSGNILTDDICELIPVVRETGCTDFRVADF